MLECISLLDIWSIVMIRVNMSSIAFFDADCFLRYVVEKGWKCNFLLGKLREVSVEAVAIQRLKLVATVTKVKLSVIISKELSYNFNRVVFWTDSTAVIRNIANESKRFKTYIANRLALIREHTKLYQWRYVTTHLNPSDAFSCSLMLTL